MFTEITNKYAESFWHLMCEMAPYLLLGFFIAGLLNAFVPRSLFSRHLASHSLKSVIKAAILGIPLPLCSCGVIPTTAALRREGASKGAATSFLIATPQTGVDSIMATYSVMGPVFAIIRPLAALITSFFGGWAVNKFDDSDSDISQITEHSHCESSKHGNGSSCCNQSSDNNTKVISFTGKLKQAFEYGFVDMMQDVGKWLIIGLLIAALITVAVPADFFGCFGENTLLSMVLVLLVAVPMYLCATGSIPIAVSLMMKGLSPGTALVMLMAGPASNMASILVVRKIMGKKTLCIYLASIITGAIICGLAMDYLMPREWFALTSTGMMAEICCNENGPSTIEIISGIILVALLINAMVIKRFLRNSYGHNSHNATNSTDGPTYIIKVSGMNCSHCSANVESAIKSVPGVTQVKVVLEYGEAHVWCDSCTAEQVAAAIDKAGYECRII